MRSPLHRPAVLRRLFNLYPPFVGAGIRVKHIAPDWREIHAEMPLTRLNRNYKGVHFGGSLYSLIDPFYMLMLIHLLGPGYVVWDMAASIRFVKPGRGRVSATFRLSPQQVEAVRAAADTRGKHAVTWPVEILDEGGEVVARAEKTLYVRRAAPGAAV
ncbi:DUF4442 domain-containing protein [Myxococcota bacterium]|nr:DUF4442 domain-containing protein [Myxococcota bacterium]MBU1429563.1 DUF4442 domain-containing protein [Myxococcota bacterium]MBU1896571.1 DUF4442 domain-containing protein [Myxococcota bacterium]